MQIELFEGDITRFAADAIVNAANTSLLGGGGVDGAIHRAAGPELLAECRTLHGCATGQAKRTGAYRLPARYVIHTPGPIWHGGHQNEAALLQSCYTQCLRLADDSGCRSIAFPSISTGVYRFPLDLAAPIAIQTLAAFSGVCLQKATMVCFDAVTYAAYQQAVQALDDAHEA